MKCSPPQCIASTPPHDMTTDQNQDILWLSFISSWRKCAQTHQTHVVTYCTVHVMYRLCKLHKEYSSSMNVSWAFSQHSLHCFCNTAKAYVLFCFVETWRTGMSFRVNSHFSLFHDWIHFILRYKIHQQLFLLAADPKNWNIYKVYHHQLRYNHLSNVGYRRKIWFWRLPSFSWQYCKCAETRRDGFTNC